MGWRMLQELFGLRAAPRAHQAGPAMHRKPHTRGDGKAVAAALLAHLLLGLLLWAARVPALPAVGGGRVVVMLETPAEQPVLPFLVATLPGAEAPPQPPPDIPARPQPPQDAAPSAPPPATLPPEVEQALREERERLVARLQGERAVASAIVDEAARTTPPPPPAGAARAPARLGTVRELDLTGQPQGVIDGIMAKYRMSIREKYVSGRNTQSFLSSAATEGDERFYATRAPTPGIYTVFQLSREAVAHMSRLEEQEIRRRGLKPESTRVTRVVFGISASPSGAPDLGIRVFEWERVL